MAGKNNDAPLTYDRLLELSELRQEEITVPRWGKVTIRELSTEELMQIRRDSTHGGVVNEMEQSKRTTQAVLVDPPLTLEQIDALFKLSPEPINAVASAWANLNNLGAGGMAKVEESFPDKG